MWFQDYDGGYGKAIHGRRELRDFAKQYDFNADEVIKEGEIKFLDEDGFVCGGVFRHTSKDKW
jgi:hypothetical protein